MSEAAISRDASDLEMIEAMTRCAFELGVVASEIAKRAGDDVARFLAAADEFRRCFFAVRMGIRLAQALRTGALAARAAAPAEPPERERERPEAADWPKRDDTNERLETEREREGDYEPVSLPRFLNTLRGVAARAVEADLPAHVRDTTLPTLRDLLRQAKAPPDDRARRGGAASAVAVLSRPTAVPAARSRLLTSTVTPGIPPLRPPPPGRRDSG